MQTRDKVGKLSIRKLKVDNFKGLDSFEIEFPPPRMKNDPDVFALGSKNGLGKTSVLESAALLTLYTILGGNDLIFSLFRNTPIKPYELFIRAGKRISYIKGVYDFCGEEISIELRIDESGFYAGSSNKVQKYCEKFFAHLNLSDLMDSSLLSLVGMNPEPLLLPLLMFFHSYRKVQEGKPEFGMMVGDRLNYRKSPRPGYEYPISTFKVEILRSMMEKADLFETLEDENSSEVLDKLNELVKRYAGGTISKLRPSPDNTIDFRIVPTKGGKSFTFDGLSSGQKEIISTLFLVWYYSRSHHGIVLIDEPELHLNAEWHRDFVKQVTDLVPDNQYIIATHSEDIFASVPEDHRALLVESEARRR